MKQKKPLIINGILKIGNPAKYVLTVLAIFFGSSFPIISLYCKNILEISLVEIKQLLLFNTLFFSALILIFAKTGSNAKTIIYRVTLLNIVSLIYGTTISYLERFTGFLPFYRELQIIPLVIITYTILSRQILKQLYVFIKIFLLVILVTSTLNIFLINNQASSKKEINQINTNETVQKLPDIYHIILDEFASSNTIEKYYEINNSNLEKALVAYNFDIFDQSYTKFSSTWPNLASMLNQELVNTDIQTKDLYPMILNSKVSQKLKKIGYKYIYISDQKLNFGNYDNPFSDYSLKDYNKSNNTREEYINPVTKLYLENSLFKILIKKESDNVLRLHELNKHKMLEAVTKNNDYSPKYVFLHSMITHKPFLFKLDGSATKYEDQQNCSNKSIYRNSYIYSKHKLLENIDMIIKSNSNSIIIVQSDHGPRFEELGNEWKKIFNAILIPGYTTGKHIQNGFSNIETYDYIFKNSQIIK